MEFSDYSAARKYIEEKALALMDHEKKGMAVVGFPPQNYSVLPIEGRTFYAVATNIFRGIIFRNGLIKATQAQPKNFGNCNAVSVIQALNEVEPIYPELKDVIRILQNENCCYVVENDQGKVPDKVLRLDLFRKLDPIRSKEGEFSFTGGLFHALKHFSINGKPLSTGNDINDLTHPGEIVPLAIRAFYIEPGGFVDDSTYESFLNLDSKYHLKFVFYHEPKTRVFFIKTIHKQEK